MTSAMVSPWRRELLVAFTAVAIAAVIIVVSGRTPSRIAYDATIEEAADAMRQKQKAFIDRFHLGTHGRFDWSQEEGVIVFSSNGLPKVAADIQFVGSFSNTSKTWLWAWANDTVLAKMSADSQRVLQFGRERHFKRLTEAKWPAEEVDCWNVTSLQAHLTGAEGMYRTSKRDGDTYLTLRNTHWVKRGEQFNFLPAESR
jgi:hypothetical protein